MMEIYLQIVRRREKRNQSTLFKRLVYLIDSSKIIIQGLRFTVPVYSIYSLFKFLMLESAA